MKLSQLIEELQKFRGVVDDPEVVYWNPDIGDHEQIHTVSTIQIGTREVVEIVGVPF